MMDGAMFNGPFIRVPLLDRLQIETDLERPLHWNSIGSTISTMSTQSCSLTKSTEVKVLRVLPEAERREKINKLRHHLKIGEAHLEHLSSDPQVSSRMRCVQEPAVSTHQSRFRCDGRVGYCSQKSASMTTNTSRWGDPKMHSQALRICDTTWPKVWQVSSD
jgi:hypothetical protein